jgi:hypothetical protein
MGQWKQCSKCFHCPIFSCADVIIAKAYFIFREKERSRNPDFPVLGFETEQVDFR